MLIRRARDENWDELDLRNNIITTLPSEIGELTNLDVLDLSETGLTVLPPEIGQLTNLRVLEVSKNQLTNLPKEIGQLTQLMWLDLEHNLLSTLPTEIQNLSKLEKLNLTENHLLIPSEIVARIYQPQAILNYYFSSLNQNKKPLNEIKLIVVGQGSVGKTSLVQRILYNRFDLNENKTNGIAIKRWTIDGDWESSSRKKTDFQAHISDSQIKLNIWDFGGQEIMHATHQFFLTKRSLYLLVLDARLTQEENRVEYWLKIIQSFGGESPVLMVGNKTDQHSLDIDKSGLKKKYPNIIGILETSAATGAGIDTLRQVIATQVQVVPHIRDLLAEAWFTIKMQLENLRGERNFISHDEYENLCNENDVCDTLSQDTLIGFLHDLGVILHFQDEPRLEALGILNPQWVTNGVYKIINSRELFENQGLLRVEMLKNILDPAEYPSDKRMFVVDMMKRFELCYDIVPDRTFLVPDLLPKDEPELHFYGLSAFSYQYPVLPPSVITRFIVRMNQHIYKNMVWRSGVLLKIGENLAMIKADMEDKTIFIAIDGLERTRRDALSAIRYQLDEIHASIKGLNPQKRVPVPGAPLAEPLEYDYLLMLERDGQDKLSIKDGNRLVTVDVRQLLSGIDESKYKEHNGTVTHIYVGGNVGGSVIAGDGNTNKE